MQKELRLIYRIERCLNSEQMERRLDTGLLFAVNLPVRFEGEICTDDQGGTECLNTLPLRRVKLRKKLALEINFTIFCNQHNFCGFLRIDA